MESAFSNRVLRVLFLQRFVKNSRKEIKMKKPWSKPYIILFVTAILVFAHGSSFAIPSADLSYSETDLGGGTWQYDYTVYNTSDDPGYDLFEVFLTFDPLATPSPTALPSDWDFRSGAGFFNTFSLIPGAPPIGSDVAPGTSLGGFSFTTDYQLGDMGFDIYLFNPTEPDPLVIYGSTGTPVPEPVSGLLFGTGLAGLAYARKRSSRKNSGDV